MSSEIKPNTSDKLINNQLTLGSSINTICTNANKAAALVKQNCTVYKSPIAVEKLSTKKDLLALFVGILNPEKVGILNPEKADAFDAPGFSNAKPLHIQAGLFPREFIG